MPTNLPTRIQHPASMSRPRRPASRRGAPHNRKDPRRNSHILLPSCTPTMPLPVTNTTTASSNINTTARPNIPRRSITTRSSRLLHRHRRSSQRRMNRPNRTVSGRRLRARANTSSLNNRVSRTKHTPPRLQRIIPISNSNSRPPRLLRPHHYHHAGKTLSPPSPHHLPPPPAFPAQAITAGNTTALATMKASSAGPVHQSKRFTRRNP